MKTLFSRGFAVLCLLAIAPRAQAATIEIVTIRFEGIITEISTFFSGSGLPPIPPPVSVGDVVTGTFSVTRYFGASNWTNASIFLQSGSWSAGASDGTFLLTDAKIGVTDELTASADRAERVFSFLTLRDPTGQAYTAGAPITSLMDSIWTSGGFSTVDREKDGSKWVSVRGLVTVPDQASTVLMLAVSLLVMLTLSHCRSAPRPRGL
jgi:hypothetical protein